MPLNYRKNDITLTSEYYSDVNDLNGPGVCKDTKVNLVVGNERKYIGLVDSGHEQASDLSVQVGNKTLKLAKKSKYMTGQSNYALNFKAIGANGGSFPPDFGGKSNYDEFIPISEEYEIVKVLYLFSDFKLLNVIKNGEQEKTVYWREGFLTFKDFPFQVMEYASYSDLKMIITKDNKFYEWYESRDWRTKIITFYKNNSDNFINDVNNSQDVVKINSLNELTNKYSNISFSSMSIGTHYTGVHVLFLDTLGKLYVKGNNNYGQLSFSTKVTKNVTIPQNILENETFKKVYASQAASTAIDSNNNLYVWGNYNADLGFDSFVPRKLQTNGVDIKVADIIFGYYAILVLDIFGKIYSWGSNGYAELGYGDGTTRQTTPLLISVDPLTVFTSLNIQNNLVVAITNDNKLYVWGKDQYWLQNNMLTNDNGSSDYFTSYHPTPILNNFQIKKIIFKQFLTTDGQIFKLENNKSPLLISSSNVFKDFFSDYYNSQFAITIQNKLMGIGSNSNNELLKKTIETEFVDLNIDLEIKKIVNFIGGQQYIILTKDNKFYNYQDSILTDTTDYLTSTTGLININDLYILTINQEFFYFIFIDEINNKNFAFFAMGNNPPEEILKGKKILDVSGSFILANDNKIYTLEEVHLNPQTLEVIPKFDFEIHDNYDVYYDLIKNAIRELRDFKVSDIEFESISAYTDNLLAIGKNKKLYVMGKNSSGQLGDIGSCDGTPITELTMICSTCSFLKVSMAGHTSMAIGEDKKLYTWGSNYGWELGIDPLSCEIILPPFFEGGDPVVTNLYSSRNFINLLPHCQFLDISKGDANMLMATDITGKLYAWGNNNYSSLGSGVYCSEIKQIGQVNLNTYSKINVGNMNSIIEEKTVTGTQGAWLGENEFLLDEENVHQPD